MTIEMEKRAIQYLKSFEPDDGYYLAYSGGKDSDVILALAKMAEVKFEAVHNNTTVDAPETIYHVREMGVRINSAHDKDGNFINMERLIIKNKLPPTRLMRYCCSVFKEQGGKGKIVITGVRKAESVSRSESAELVRVIGKPKTTQKEAKESGVDYRITKSRGLVLNDDNSESRRFVEHCYRTRKTMVNPIVDWEDKDVWDFLRHYQIRINPLYGYDGCNRIGCIGCPHATKSHRLSEFVKYPKYKERYLRAFEGMLKNRKENGLPTPWSSAEEVMKWWLEDDECVGQLTFDDL